MQDRASIKYSQYTPQVGHVHSMFCTMTLKIELNGAALLLKLSLAGRSYGYISTSQGPPLKTGHAKAEIPDSCPGFSILLSSIGFAISLLPHASLGPSKSP